MHQSVRDEYNTRRRIAGWALLPLFVCVGLCALAMYFVTEDAIFGVPIEWIAAVGFFGGILFYLVHWYVFRCPLCDQYPLRVGYRGVTVELARKCFRCDATFD